MKRNLCRIIIGAVLFFVSVIFSSIPEYITLGLYIAAYLIIGYDVLWRAIRNILNGKVFDENFLMALATIGAFAIKEYPEAVAVMLFYQVGELFQTYAVGKSRKSIATLMDIRPDYANLIKDGESVRVDPDEVHIGDIILVAPGEKIPLDGTVISGSSFVDTAALTGESVPSSVHPGDTVLSGCINQTAVINVEVHKEFYDSTVSKILDLVENASSKKSRSENFITRFAAVYTPIVVIAAVLLAALPPLLIPGAQFSDWLYRALSFLVVSCPCALVISIPMSFFGGIGGASKEGILVKGSLHLEELSKCETIVFDKTGTLTAGVFEVQETKPVSVSEATLLEAAAYAESFSSHPIASSIKRAYGKEIEQSRLGDTEEISGHGIRAVVDGKVILAGNEKLMTLNNISALSPAASGTIVHIAIDGEYAGYILIADKIKPDSAKAISDLKSAGIRNTVMLTGDRNEVAQDVGTSLGIDKVYSELLPADKVEKVEELLSETSAKGRLVFVGDGINDAPVLARADIGIAMGGLGSDAAIEAADIVIMTDEPSKISTAIKISKKTLSIVTQNIIFAIGVKAIVLVLSAFGISTMWEAVFADVGVAFIAILNAMRALKSA